MLVREPLDFQSNRLFDLWSGERHYIVKEYLKADELELAPLREYKTLHLLSSLDIAPRPVFYDSSIGPFVVYEYMDGEMWDRRPIPANGLEHLAKLWLKIQSVQADWISRGQERSIQEIVSDLKCQFENYLEWTRRYHLPGERAASLCLELLGCRRPILDELASMQPGLCFCRADPRFANVIQRPGGKLGMVDWEDSGLRDPAKELVDIVSHPNQEDLLDWNEWKPFIEVYLKYHSERDRDIEKRIHFYMGLVPFFWLAILLRGGMNRAATGRLDHHWTVNGLPANLRLQRYLARAQAWPDHYFEPALNHLREINFFPIAD